MMARELQGKRVAALVDDRFEAAELFEPKQALELAGARVEVISRHARLTSMRHHDPGPSLERDRALAEADAGDYDTLLLPGGVVNGDSLRIVPEAQRIVKLIAGARKPIAVICHGGWILISCGLVRGRTLTSWPTLQDDYRNAGAHWVDREVVRDGNWVSSRKPDDIPAFNREMLALFAESKPLAA